MQLVDSRFWANNHTHILQGSGVSTRFLYLATSRHPIAGHVTGAAQPKITQANLNRLPITVASPSIQRAFERTVDPLFDELRVIKGGIEPLAATRDLLLPKLVTGEINVSKLDLDALMETAGA